MKATKFSRGLTKLAIFCLVFIAAFSLISNTGGTASAAYYYRSTILSPYTLPSINLPTGAGSTINIDGEDLDGALFSYNLISGADNGFSETMNWYWQGDSAPSGYTTDAETTEITDTWVRFFKRGVTAGYNFFAWSYIRLPDEIVNQSSMTIRARMTFNWEANNYGGAFNAYGALGSYSDIPTENYGHTLVSGGTSPTLTYSGSGGISYNGVQTGWVTLTAGSPYIVVNLVNQFPEDVGGTVRLDGKFTNVKLELFVEYDGQGPTITPWYNNYSVDADGDYIRAADGINFINVGNDNPLYQGVQKWNVEATLQSFTQSYYNGVDGFDPYVYKQNSYYYDKNGKVYCHNVLDDNLDNGSTNTFNSYQNIVGKRVSFIVYDNFAGLGDITIYDGSATNTLMPDTSNVSYSFGSVTTTTFGYTFSYNTDGPNRGMGVDIIFTEWGEYTVTAYDAFGAVTIININIGGMDTEDPELPTLSITNAGSNGYYRALDGRLTYALIINHPEGASQSDVIYAYILEKKNSLGVYEIISEDILDGTRVSVQGGSTQIITLYNVTSGYYRYTVRCSDGAGNIGVDDTGAVPVDFNQWEFTVDSATPNLTVAAKAGTADYVSGTWVKRTVSVDFDLINSTDVISGVSYFYRIGATGDFLPVGTGKVKYTFGNEGDIDAVVYFKAISGSGVESTIRTINMKIDMTAPVSPICYGYLDYNVNDVGNESVIYNYPWGQPAAFDLDGEPENYVNNYIYYYYVTSMVEGITYVGGTHSVSFLDAFSSIIDIFDDGYSTAADRAWGAKYLHFYVVDQAGQQSSVVTYQVNTVVPVVNAVIERSGKAGRMYDGTAVAAQDMFMYTLTINGQTVSAYMSGENALYFGANDTFIINIDASFDSKNVGAGRLITVNGVSLSGNSYASYYTVVYDESSVEGFTADIDVVPLTIEGITAANKMYDGTTAASLVSRGAIKGLGTTVAAEDLAQLDWNYSSIAFTDKNVLTGIAVDILGITLTGSAYIDLNNYSLDFDSVQVYADITFRVLVIDQTTVEDKVYDGTAAAVVNITLKGAVEGFGILDGEDVRTSYTANFGALQNDASAGTNKTVRISVNEALLGNDRANYKFAAVNITSLASISKRPVTISKIFAIDKTYDGTSKADFGALNKSNYYSLENVVASDSNRIALIFESAYFINEALTAEVNAGSHYVMFTGVSLKNNVGIGETMNTAANYDLQIDGDKAVISTQTSKINRKSIRLTASASSKAYDGSALPTGVTITIDSRDIILGDNIHIGTIADVSSDFRTVTFIDPYNSNVRYMVNVIMSSYASPNASNSAAVNLVYGSFVPYDADNPAHAGEILYKLSFNEAAYGEYVKSGSVYVSYDPSDPTHSGVTRYTLFNSIVASEADSDILYVVQRQIYNADGSLNNNYYYVNEDIVVNTNRTLSFNLSAPISSLPATARIIGIYGIDKSGNPYKDAVTGDILYIDHFIYGGTAVLIDSTDREIRVKPVTYGYTVLYSGMLGGDAYDLKTLGGVNAKITELTYSTLNAGGSHVVNITNATLTNYNFVGGYVNLSITVLPADLTVSIPGTYEKKHNEIINLSDYRPNYVGLQGSDSISTLLGFEPVVKLITGWDSLGKPVYYVSGNLGAGYYDFALDLTPKTGYSSANYTIKIDTSDPRYSIDGNLIIKTDALTVGKVTYNGLKLSDGSYTYNASAAARPLQPTGVYPSGTSIGNITYQIAMYCLDADLWIRSLKAQLSDSVWTYTVNRYNTATGIWETVILDGTKGAAVYSWFQEIATYDNSVELAEWLTFSSVNDGGNREYNYTITKAKHAGKYKVTCTLDESAMSDYFTIVLTANLIINARTVKVIAPAYSYDKIYDGKKVDLLSAIGEARVSNASIVTSGRIVYQYSESVKFTTYVTNLVDAGTYYARAYFIGDNNTKSAYSDIITVTIVPIKVLVQLTTPTQYNYDDYFDKEGNALLNEDNNPKTYGIEFNLFDLGVYSNPNDAIDYNELLKNSVKIEYLWARRTNVNWDTAVPTKKGSFIYRITCSDGNYSLISEGILTGNMVLGSNNAAASYKDIMIVDGVQQTSTADDTKVNFSSNSGSLLSVNGAMTVTGYNSNTQTYQNYAAGIDANSGQLGTGTYTLGGLFYVSYTENGVSAKLNEAVKISVSLNKTYDAKKYQLVHVSPTGVLTPVQNVEFKNTGKTIEFVTDDTGMFALVEKSGLGISSTLLVIIIAVAAALVVFSTALLLMSSATRKAKKKVIAYLSVSQIDK